MEQDQLLQFSDTTSDYVCLPKPCVRDFYVGFSAQSPQTESDYSDARERTRAASAELRPKQVKQWVILLRVIISQTCLSPRCAITTKSSVSQTVLAEQKLSLVVLNPEMVTRRKSRKRTA